MAKLNKENFSQEYLRKLQHFGIETEEQLEAHNAELTRQSMLLEESQPPEEDYIARISVRLAAATPTEAEKLAIERVNKFEEQKDAIKDKYILTIQKEEEFAKYQ